MATDLKVFPPIEIPYRKAKAGSSKHITAQHVTAFWNSNAAQEIKSKQGCYVFALRAAKGFCPWYVGKATKSFEQECFEPHKRNHYNDVLFDGRKGKPVLFLIAPDGKKNKVPAKDCDAIETFLIQAAYTENPLIKNRQKTKIPSWTIAGVVRPNRGPVAKDAAAFRKMMGLSKS